MSKKVVEYVGWMGVILILSGYALLSTGLAGGNSITYHGLTLVGSALLAILSYKKQALQPAVLNTVFFGLALVAIARIVFSTI